MSYRNPADLVREKTEPQPKIHEERQERAAELEEQHEAAFQETVDEQEAEQDEGDQD